MTPTNEQIDEAAKYCPATRKCEGCPFYGTVEIEGRCPEHFAKAYLSSRAEVEELRKALEEVKAWIGGIYCKCDHSVGLVCDRCYLLRTIRKALEGKE